LLLGTVVFLSLLHRFVASRGRNFLRAAFLVAGISVWYKAIFIFPLAAIVVAGVLAYRSEIRRHLSPQNILSAMIGFGVGSAPLIAFNPSPAGATFYSLKIHLQRASQRKTPHAAADARRARA